MIAVDTNVLVYAHRGEFPEHQGARRRLLELADGGDFWAIPVFCLGEFLRVVTHPAILHPPSPLAAAIDALTALLRAPSLRILHPGEEFPRLLFQAVTSAGASGNLVFDAQIVAVCHEHGVRRLWTYDRDFARFEGVETTDAP